MSWIHLGCNQAPSRCSVKFCVVWHQLWHSKQVPRGRSCTEPRMPGVAAFACRRHMHWVHTHVHRPPTMSQARRQGDHGGGPPCRGSGSPQQPRREEGLPEVTAEQNDTSKSKAELPQGGCTSAGFGEGAGQPSRKPPPQSGGSRTPS